MDISIRKVASEDCDILFEWANEEDVRRNSFNQEKISYTDHVKWFNSKLQDNNAYMFMCLLDEQKIGQVKIDIKDSKIIIGYSIAKEFRGKGYAFNMIKLLEEEIVKENINGEKIVACVKYTNIPSQKVFKKLGYEENYHKDHIQYYKIL